MHEEVVQFSLSPAHAQVLRTGLYVCWANVSPGLTVHVVCEVISAGNMKKSLLYVMHLNVLV